MKQTALKRILRYVRPYWLLVLLSLLCAACSAGAQLLIPIFTGDVLDLLIGPGKVQWAEIFFLFGLDESIFLNYAKTRQSQGGQGFERFLLEKPEEAKTIINKAMLACRARNAARKAREITRKTD